MVVLDQHIKFLEGNYSATIAVSWERQTWGHYRAVNGEGRRGESQSNLAILNILRHIIMVWLRKKWTGAVLDTCTYLCVCLRLLSMSCRHHVCLIITPQSFLASLSRPLSLSPSSIHLSCSFVKASVPNKAHSHAERMWGSTEWFQLTPQLHTASPSMSPPSSFILSPNTLRPPKNILALFFYFLHNVSLSFSIYVLYICHTQFVSLLRQPIRALCRLLHPEALGLNTFFYAGKRKHFYSFNSSPRSSL